VYKKATQRKAVRTSDYLRRGKDERIKICRNQMSHLPEVQNLKQPMGRCLVYETVSTHRS